jgi:hypothetical protein
MERYGFEKMSNIYIAIIEESYWHSLKTFKRFQFFLKNPANEVKESLCDKTNSN